MAGRLTNIRPKPGYTMDQVMGVRAMDGLANALTGSGTRRDPRTASTYLWRPLTQAEIAAAYSGSGLMRKIITIPALDMVREWRSWQLEAEQITAVENEEKRLGILNAFYEAEKLRDMGGGAIIMGLPGNPSEPVPDTVGLGTLSFVHVVSRWHLSFDTLQNDAREPGYGDPVMWKLQSAAGQQTIHPSRVIPFRADTTATIAMVATSTADQYWGESVVAQVLDAVKDSDTARASFAALLHKARTLRIGIRGLYEMMAAGEDEKVMKRLAILAQAESIHNAIIFDAGDAEGKGGEQIEDATYSFSGAKDVLNFYAEFCAAVSDIPATRLLGRAPEGLNSSGESQQLDWNKLVRARQEMRLSPCIDKLDRHLVPSALGRVPDATAWYRWNPLSLPSEKDEATRFKTLMEAIEKLQASATMPEIALAKGVQNLMSSEGFLPGIDAALADVSEEVRTGIGREQRKPESEVIELSAGEGGGSVPARRAANDAKPRALYVRRNLLNAADLVAWAKDNGFSSTLSAADMHVTVLYSRKPVDPIAMGEDGWGMSSDGGIKVLSGPRALERFDGGAVVLQFASSALSYRHEDMIRRGASHDFPDYLPHVTLTYNAPADFDIDAIKPFAGELRFGPEIFENLDEDWKSGIVEA